MAHLHGTFKKQALAIFDEYNQDSEQFFFDGNEAIPSEFLSFSKRRDNKVEKTSTLKSIIIINDERATSSNEDNSKSRALNEANIDVDELRFSKIHNDGVLDKVKKKGLHI